MLARVWCWQSKYIGIYETLLKNIRKLQSSTLRAMKGEILSTIGQFKDDWITHYYASVVNRSFRPKKAKVRLFFHELILPSSLIVRDRCSLYASIKVRNIKLLDFYRVCQCFKLQFESYQPNPIKFPISCIYSPK